MMTAQNAFYIYGTMTEAKNRTECVSLHDVLSKFKEVVRVYRQRGHQVSEANDRKWLITDAAGKTDAIWIEDPQGQVIQATEV